ncbi:hypothetical protein Hdeb2414_s0012g00386261 [Helianthus debilis subsp. tardiflorus]
MMLISFESFVLAHLLVSFALQTLSIHGAHYQERRSFEGNPIKETQETDVSFKEEVAKTLGICSGSNAVRIGGRKMGMISKEDGEMASGSSKGEAQKLNVEEGFVAFTADYHMAKHHSPRNN